MTFEQYYQEVVKQANVNATGDYERIKNYVRILWSNAYTIEQASNSLKTIDDEN